jgi:hypothetical protein
MKNYYNSTNNNIIINFDEILGNINSLKDYLENDI